MKLIQIYQCLCDETRLRILYLLSNRKLCVSDLTEILKLPQVKVSKHLAYMKEKGMVEAKRQGYWVIYSLPETLCPELDANLKCLHDCVLEHSIFRQDLKRLESLKQKVKP